MALPNEKVESVLVHMNEYDTYAVANRMARRLLENDKYLEGVIDTVVVDIPTTDFTVVSTVPPRSAATVSHELSRQILNVVLVNNEYAAVVPASVVYHAHDVVIQVVTTELTHSPGIWHLRLS